MTITGIAKNQMSDALTKLTTMQRINSAADDAAGLAIMEKMEAQIEGLERGSQNTLDMQGLLKTAEGGLSVIDDSLNRIRELSVQASNGIYTDEDRALIQNEVSQLIQGIDDIARSTQYNNMNILDGSFTNRQTASSPDGSGVTVSIADMSASALGLEDYDVTGSFDIDVIDKALNAVSTTRSYLGSLSNRMDYTVDSNSIMMLNQMAAKSRIADLDIAKVSTDASRERIMNEIQIYSQKRQQETMQTPLSILM